MGFIEEYNYLGLDSHNLSIELANDIIIIPD